MRYVPSDSNPVSFSPELHQRIGPVVELLGVGWSNRKFVQACVEAILQLADAPDNSRSVPEIVREIDEALAKKRRFQIPVKLKPRQAVNSGSAVPSESMEPSSETVIGALTAYIQSRRAVLPNDETSSRERSARKK